MSDIPQTSVRYNEDPEYRERLIKIATKLFGDYRHNWYFAATLSAGMRNELADLAGEWFGIRIDPTILSEIARDLAEIWGQENIRVDEDLQQVRVRPANGRDLIKCFGHVVSLPDPKWATHEDIPVPLPKSARFRALADLTLVISDSMTGDKGELHHGVYSPYKILETMRTNYDAEKGETSLTFHPQYMPNVRDALRQLPLISAGNNIVIEERAPNTLTFNSEAAHLINSTLRLLNKKRTTNHPLQPFTQLKELLYKGSLMEMLDFISRSRPDLEERKEVRATLEQKIQVVLGAMAQASRRARHGSADHVTNQLITAAGDLIDDLEVENTFYRQAMGFDSPWAKPLMKALSPEAIRASVEEFIQYRQRKARPRT